ncbi:class IV adenylate cyclase [Treponema sp.]|uniref:class IV adenylate cyclase n=1 Tax=Treponema sp. TaxID=166 RepID=UPI003F00910D
MNEIEIKARVYNKSALVETLKTFAEFKGEVEKTDVYYESPLNPVKIRIRKEKRTDGTTCIVTYKRKERKAASGTFSTELNEELEAELSCAEPLEQFFQDAGFKVALKKQKQTMAWQHTVSSQGESFCANLEICTVPPLGTFLEIEIISPSKKEEDVEKIQGILFELLEKCGIEKSCIEQRYYSELLQEEAVKHK